MGTISDYICTKCGATFNARCGGGFQFVELRCEACDETQTVDRGDWPVDYREVYEKIDPSHAKTLPVWTPETLAAARAKFRCKKCGAQAHEDLKPMCPNCHSREVIEGRPTVHFD